MKVEGLNAGRKSAYESLSWASGSSNGKISLKARVQRSPFYLVIGRLDKTIEDRFCEAISHV